MLPDSLPAAASLATGVYAALSVPVLLVVDDPTWPTRRELIERPAGDRLLVEITRARLGAAQVRDRALLSLVSWLLVIAAHRAPADHTPKGATR